MIAVPLAAPRVDDVEAMRVALTTLLGPSPAVLGGTCGPDSGPHIAPGILNPRSKPDADARPIRITLDGDHIQFIRDQSDASTFWPWLRRLILGNRQDVARLTGIASLAWLDELKEPEKSPKLAAVIKAYTDRHDLSEKEASKAGGTWKSFTRGVGVATLRELTPALVAAWGLKVKKQGLAAKTVQHTFNRVKTVLNHFRTTGVGVDDVRHALDCCAVLKAPDSTSLDPHPIARADFAALLEKAEGEGKAMLLVALNLCFYPVDVARLRWADIDLERDTYHAKRGKTKVARAGVLWVRTVEALRTVDRVDDCDHVFHKSNAQPHTDTTVRKWFWRLREAAKVEKAVQFADIRDGAFTEAAAGDGVEFQHARVLAGHRSGIADAYVRRNPKMVAKACEAVERAYFA